MNIENLKTFCLVVDEGSISQAARLRFISQPAVTRQIHQLENFYGTLLFDRTDGKLTVTEAGKMLYPFATSIINDFTRSKEVIRTANDELNKNLFVGASLTIGEYLLPSLLGRFKKMNPELNITLSIKNTPSVLEDLANNVIDIAMVEGIVENNGFATEKFADDELILVYPPDHHWNNLTEIKIEQLINERMIWRESHSGTRLIVENTLRDHGVLDKIHDFMEISSTQAIKSTVEAGLGISILSRLTVARELELGTLKEMSISGVTIKRSLWLVKKAHRFNRPGVSQFVQFIKD
ncbi:LysR family transcriptional regulator [Metabacillus malikii]|uniref:DNA-binding transcriptional LysR family regulator n=1 Tax=Metabacillus malikii TaxID=1504265 RepID=A0ABT9ZGP1_9BACI|nr:LysR family transcriptional regulator [Metabacillus malikii]MDQ0230703.1 DNA-binding transcriptional LysR family regulator [Metabacillus malikii]